MKCFKKYQGIELSKNQCDFVDFIQTGSNDFWEAYYIWKLRKKRVGKPTIQIASWFNRILAQIHKKGLLKEIPFVLHSANDVFIWANPGINASKANFECLTLHDAQMEMKLEMNKII